MRQLPLGCRQALSEGLVPVQLPGGHILGAVDDDSRPWVPTTRLGALDGFAVSGLGWLTPVIVGI